MIELTRTRRLTIAIIVFIVLIIIGFLTLKNPKYVYNISTQEMLDEMNEGNGQVDIKELEEILASGGNSVVFVDLRSPYEFEKSNLVNAVNIPVSEILTDESISFFEDMKKESKEVIIFGDDHLASNSTWMIIRQLGFDNTKMIVCDYNIFNLQNENQDDSLQTPVNKPESPIVNFAEYVKSNTEITDQNLTNKENTKQIIPTRRKKKAITAGGC